MILKARAKINLTLDVVGKRENGYHELKMIMQSINLYDTIKLTPIKTKTIKLSSNALWLPTHKKNIAYRAAALFLDTASIDAGVKIEIMKRIPAEAGLGGGSTDAAAVLVGLNHLFQCAYSQEKLMELGISLGADVPFCIVRNTMLAEGIGEILTPLPSMPRTFIVLVKPPFGASTAEVYGKFNLATVHQHPDTTAVIKALQKGNIKEIASHMINVLEDVTVQMHPEIEVIKQKFLRYGALNALMSGSGSTVFGLFENEQLAQNAAKRFKKSYKQVYVTTTYTNRGKKNGN